jgi:hypothetical protein
MLEMILVLPREMRDFKLQVPALTQALKLGVNYYYIAKVALDCLKEWVDDNDPGLQSYLSEILPLLELYFREQRDIETSNTGAVSIQKKDAKYNYQIKKKTGFRRRAQGAASLQNDEKNLALR